MSPPPFGDFARVRDHVITRVMFAFFISGYLCNFAFFYACYLRFSLCLD